jgi:deoxyribose-phosphate aldolase
MKLDEALAHLVAESESAAAGAAPEAAARRAVGLLDLTSLDEDDDEARIEALCAKARTPAGPVAAVCVYPRFVALSKRLLAGTGIGVATVVNFPAGGADPEAAARETRDAVALGADEIDAVIPWRDLLAGDEAPARAVLSACRAACPGLPLKAILETGGLGEAGAVRRASRLAIECGADFLKTSTGKLQPAATIEAAALMLDEIRAAGAGTGTGRPLGFKAAGGIRDAAGAARYLALADGIMGPGWAAPATFRFGASGLLDSLLAALGSAPASPPPGSGY